MNILVIGGSYFLGRVFTMVATNEHTLTLINRGRYSMKELGVKEYVLDRNDAEKIANLPYDDYDAVVDFCAYNSGDIKRIIENIPATIKKYIFISTVDVYERGKNYAKLEDAPLSTIRYPGEIGDYIAGKIELEKELKDICKERGISYCILRPSMIYGPYNYAQRESEYIRHIIKQRKIIAPVDSNGYFQLVYVKDVANAIMEVLKKDDKEMVYNISSSEILYYDIFIKILKKVSDIEFEIEYMAIEDILENNILAPFPLTLEETEICDGSKITEECNFSYTTLRDGMKKTYNAFKPVFN